MSRPNTAPDPDAMAGKAAGRGLGFQTHRLSDEGLRAARAIIAAARRLYAAEAPGGSLSTAQIMGAAVQFAREGVAEAMQADGIEGLPGDDFVQLTCTMVAAMLMDAPQAARTAVVTNLVIAFTEEGQALRIAMARETAEGTA